MCPCGGIFALFATVRLFSRVDSHVDSKPASLIQKVVPLWTNKRILSAVNSHVGFGIGKFGTREAALIAIVIFLCIRLDLVDFGYLGKFWFMICVFSVCWRLQSIGITEKNKVIWPGPFHEVARCNDDNDDDDDRNISVRTPHNHNQQHHHHFIYWPAWSLQSLFTIIIILPILPSLW